METGITEGPEESPEERVERENQETRAILADVFERAGLALATSVKEAMRDDTSLNDAEKVASGLAVRRAWRAVSDGLCDVMEHFQERD